MRRQFLPGLLGPARPPLLFRAAPVRQPFGPAGPAGQEPPCGPGLAAGAPHPPALPRQHGADGLLGLGDHRLGGGTGNGNGRGHASHNEQASMIRRYIIWRNNHAYDERLRRIIAKVNVT